MSSLPRVRIIRAAESAEEVFVLGQASRETIGLRSSVSDAMTVVAESSRQAEAILAGAQEEAAKLVAEAQQQADAIRAAARQQGLDDGRTEGHALGIAAANQEFGDILELLRKAAAEGQRIRDQVAGDAAPVVARATMLAVRRIVGEYYQEDPGRTSAAIQEALAAASGQEILAIRVHPDVAGRVAASLVEAGHYVAPDEGVAIGGCIIDVREGTIDAGLSTRLDLMQLALTRASGEPHS